MENHQFKKEGSKKDSKKQGNYKTTRNKFVMLISPFSLVLVAQLCLTLCDPMDCILLGSSVHWIL